MFKVFFIVLLVAIYYFTNITYTPGKSSEYIKAANSLKFDLVTEKTVKLPQWFNFYFSFGRSSTEGEKHTEKTITFSYVNK